MKLSPYYKGIFYLSPQFSSNSTTWTVFEEEAGSWEEKLNRIHVLFGKKSFLLILHILMLVL